MTPGVFGIIALSSIGLVVYSYVGYPLLLLVLAAFRQLWSDVAYVFAKRDRRGELPHEWPAVAVIISAFNEERHILERLNNLLRLDYPAERLQVYVGSDGSHDRTGALITGFGDPRVHAFAFDVNRGKAAVLCDLVARSRESVLVFTDANTFFSAGALKLLVAPFSNARVGGVSGELRLLAAAGSNQDSLYWRIEQVLKFLEARMGALLGANGAIYAIRRELWVPLHEDTICDDFCVAMNVAAKGYRLVYEPNAWAQEETPEAIGDEYRRRARIGIGNYQALFRHPEYLLRTSWATKISYLSHKVLRWLGPHLLIVGFLASLFEAAKPQWQAFVWLQILVFGGSGALYAVSERYANRGRTLPGVLNIPAFFFALNWAFLVASLRYAAGDYSGSWRRTVRSE